MARFISILVCCILFLGCRKEEPADEKNTAVPVFSFSGIINNTPVSIKAGEKNYYMYTSFKPDTGKVTEFIGEFKTYGCVSACPNSLMIRIRSNRTGQLLPADIDSSFSPGYYVLASPKGISSKYIVGFKAEKKANTTDSTTQFLWDFGDGMTGKGDTVSHLYSKPGNYTVSYTINTPSIPCFRSVSNIEKIGPAGSGCQADFTALDSGTTVTFMSTVLGGTPPYSYSWDFGDGSAGSITANPSYTYSVAGVYRVGLTVTDNNNSSAFRNYDVALQAGATGCEARYITAIYPVNNPLNFSSMIIEWTDANGVLYSSYNDNQPQDYVCQVLSVEPYQKNTDGQSTKKIHMKLTCRLYSKTITSILLENADIIFAVAHP